VGPLDLPHELFGEGLGADRLDRPAVAPRTVRLAEPDDLAGHGMGFGEPGGIVDDSPRPRLDQLALAIIDAHRDLREVS
jgi:hypothetical protein